MHVELKGNLDIHLYGFLFQAINVHKWFTLVSFNRANTVFNFGERIPNVRKSALTGRQGNKPRAKGSVIWTAGHMYAFTINSIPFFKGLLPTDALASRE